MQKRRRKRRRLLVVSLCRSNLERPNGTPTFCANGFTREDLAGAPFVAFVALDQCAIGAILIGGRIGARGRVYGAGVVRILHGTGHGIVFGEVRQVLRKRSAPWACQCTGNGYS